MVENECGLLGSVVLGGADVPKISVILPVYNMEKYLEGTISAIQAQSFDDFELICVDDGSTDSSPSILSRAAETDSRIQVISQENRGPGQARNVGLDHATGEYLIMLDSDDVYAPDMLSSLLQEARETEADVVVCRSSELDSVTDQESEAWWTLNVRQMPDKRPFSPLEMPDFVFSAFIGWPWDKLYRRSFVEEHGFRFPPLSNSEDLYFVFLSLAKAERISIVDRPLVKHRVNRAGSVSGSRASKPLQFYESTCLLKQELRKDESLYARLSWGFLNWAFTYMLWNIETMDDSVGRSIQLDALRNDGFPELEIPQHSPTFFSLEPSGYGRYLNLLREAEGMPAPRRRGRILGLLIRALSKLQRDGLWKSFELTCNVVARKLLHTPPKATPPALVRGEDFAIAGKDARRRLCPDASGE